VYQRQGASSAVQLEPHADMCTLPFFAMPPLRPLTAALHAARRLNSTRVAARQYQHVLRRACSCSAPQQLQHTVKLSSHGAQLNPTAADPPTPPTDHRALAQTHNLFITSPYSPGSPLILPNGAYVFQKLQAFLRAQYPQFGFNEVITPIIYKKSLWEKSGHWENYAEDMFSVQGRGTKTEAEKNEAGEDEEFGLKPMNCPGHCLLFRDDIKSYRISQSDSRISVHCIATRYQDRCLV
jgi:threonyl-tRNA synthetase